jgi:hypothetical protein
MPRPVGDMKREGKSLFEMQRTPFRSCGSVLAASVLGKRVHPPFTPSPTHSHFFFAQQLLAHSSEHTLFRQLC